MKNLACVILLLVPAIMFSQAKNEMFDYSFKPVKAGGYYIVVTQKQDSLYQRQAWFASQKTQYMEGWYKDADCKVAHGSFNWFHTNGNLHRTGQYVDNKKEGTWLEYNENGQLNDSSNYVNGFHKGISFSWHQNNFLKDSTNFDGAGNGVQVSWYDNGSLASAGFWKQDTLKQGRWKYYYQDGTLLATEDYNSEGKLQVCNCYDENGMVRDTSLCTEKEASVDIPKWRRFMERSLMSLVREKASQGITGNFSVVLRFIVDENGNVGDVKPLTNYGQGIEEGVLNVFKDSPKWTPGRQFGRNVKSYHTQPITFVLQ